MSTTNSQNTFFRKLRAHYGSDATRTHRHVNTSTTATIFNYSRVVVDGRVGIAPADIPPLDTTGCEPNQHIGVLMYGCDAQGIFLPIAAGTTAVGGQRAYYDQAADKFQATAPATGVTNPIGWFCEDVVAGATEARIQIVN